ncbi:MAG: MarR family winged helix-turn-helix transcriptional regulator [Hyphomicrobiales bacterium]|nr:MarR family winged helix-turn-helix transcriptional regulator [Hyphomicrobiales bacterium]
MPGHLLRRAQQLSNALFAEECGAFDLTSVQYAALNALAGHDDIDATHLASLIAFDRSTIGGVLERLVAKGWITRRTAASDRRVKRLKLTPAGRAILAEVEAPVARVQQRLLQALNVKEREAFLAALTKLIDHAPHHDHPAQAPASPV